MGKDFGSLGVIVRGIIYYKLSPHEQKPFANFGKSVLNVIPRTTQTMYTWLPPLIVTILVYYGVEESYKLSKRKNPRDFANEIEPPQPPPEAATTETENAAEGGGKAAKC